VKPDLQRILGCRGDDEIIAERGARGIEILSDIEIHGRGSPHSELKAGGGEDTNAHRLEVIQAVRDGRHLELMVKRARTYRQSKGSKNRRYLRFASDELDAVAPSFAGQPLLVDHNTYEQDKRKGTILTSSAETNGQGITSFFMGFAVVKPDAVISVLDGTIDRFSIGWFPGAEILCSVHGCNILSKDSCYCWPGEEVEVDGKLKIAEYEFKGATGKELSAVNVPAVTGTRIEEYRAALAAELQLPPTRTKERTKMLFTRLAAALGLAALSEAGHEDAALAALEGQRKRLLAAEVDVGTLRVDVARLTTERDTARAEANLAAGAAIDRVVADAYSEGKLGYGRDAAGAALADPMESLLRDFGKAAGLDALSAKLKAMAPRIPVGQRQPLPAEPARQLAAVPTDAQIAATAAQLGVPVDSVRARYGLAPLAQAGGVR
jgi:hypothetical protein